MNSFTQLDYILSPVNTLTGTFHVAPRQMEFVNLNFFDPQPVTPTFSAHDYTGTVIDRWTIGNNLLESTLAIKRFSGNGYAEIVLSGVDMTSFGADLPGSPKLGRLVKTILRQVPGVKRLRLSSM